MFIPALEKGLDFLRRTQNADGGWGYRQDNDSTTEPTAAAVLALPPSAERARALDWLLRTQRADGGWGLNAGDDASEGVGMWAVWALLIAGEEAAARRGLAWVAQMPVLRANDPISSDLLGVNPALSGWGWTADSGSWVEPTALGVLTLSLGGETEHPRRAEGLALLRDRVCRAGGWNVGAPVNFGAVMPPTPYHTALGLLAMYAAGASPGDAVVRGGQDALRRLLAEPVGAATLGWGLLALRLWNDAGSDALQASLLRRQAAGGDWEDSPHATAVALLALQNPASLFPGRTP